MGEFMKELVERLFGGSSSQLVLQALGTAKTSKQELEQIRQLLKELEDKKP
jgi:predicted transcriptional regulator